MSAVNSATARPLLPLRKEGKWLQRVGALNIGGSERTSFCESSRGSPTAILGKTTMAAANGHKTKKNGRSRIMLENSITG